MALSHTYKRHHSLVTPIDWKHLGRPDPPSRGKFLGHHSLVTPIDWKL